MQNDEFGDRMKMYEAFEASRKLIPLLPICVRIDGKTFSKWTKDLERPYDKRMADLMIATTKFLVEEVNACVGYTQSDEISLILYSNNIESQVFFNGKTHKEMLFQKGVNWNDYPDFFKRGTFIQRRKVFRLFTEEEKKNVPEKFWPTEPIERNEIRVIAMPKFSSVINRVGVIFNGEEPKTES